MRQVAVEIEVWYSDACNKVSTSSYWQAMAFSKYEIVDDALRSWAIRASHAARVAKSKAARKKRTAVT